jgi:alpha-glucosidase
MALNAVEWDHGLHSPHAKVHNVYGMLMSEGTREGMLRYHPNERTLVITRATYAGGQRFASVWTGDNSSTWDHLRLSLPELMTMGMSGIAFAGADIGGFAGSPGPELYTRWLEAGVFYPYCRTHTELGSQEQDPWAYGDRMEAINRESIELRYRLLPYLYDAFHETSETGLPVMRALLLEYPDDPQAVDRSHEFLFGDDLLVAPIYESDHRERDVYLPRGVWYDFWNDHRFTGPTTLQADAPLDRIPIFVRGGAIIPEQQVVQYTDQAPINPLTLDIYPDGSSTRQYYEDDGISFDFQKGVFLRQSFKASQQDHGLTIEISARQGSYKPPERSFIFRVHNVRQKPHRVEVGGQTLNFHATPKSLQDAAEAWTYDEYKNIVEVKVPDQGAAITARLEE